MSNNREKSSVDGSTKAVTGTSSNEARSNEQTGRDSIRDQIRVRAYELYLARGDESSDALTDWLRAERECLEAVDDRGESASAARPSQERE